MARRKDHTPEQLKLLTIKTVIEFLQHQPIAQLSLRTLAKMIGYSPGTLINLFQSYNYLLLEVSGYTLTEIGAQLAGDIADANSKSEILISANSYLKFAIEHPYQWQQVFEHHLNDSQDIPSIHQEKIDTLFNLIEPAMLKLAPNATNIEIIRASRTLWASVHGICMMSLEDKLFSPVQVTSESLIESLISHYLASWANNHADITEARSR